MARRRIMLFECSPLAPQVPSAATWDPDYYTADELAVSNGNLTITRTFVPNGYGGVRSTTPCAPGLTYWETVQGGGAGHIARVGIALEGWQTYDSLGIWVDGLSVAGMDTNGDAWYRTVRVLNLASVPNGTVVRHLVDTVAGRYSVAVGAGAWQVVIEHRIITRSAIYPAATVYQLAAVTVNFGATPFAYAVPAGANLATSAAEPQPVPVYLSSAPFGTLDKDDPPSTLYQARIDAAADLVIRRSAGCWLWGNQAASSRGSITVLNGDRRFDHWITDGWIWRDAPYTVLTGYEGDDRGDFTVYARGVVDSIRRDGDRRLVLSLRDPLARADVPLQSAMYANTPNAQIIDTPRPIALGRPMYVPGVRLSTANTGPLRWTYDVHDAALAGIDAAYDQGDIFDTGDYTVSAGATGITLANKPAGRICICPRGATVDMGAGPVLTETLPTMMRWLVSRLGWPDDAVDWASIDALHALAPYRVADYIAKEISVLGQFRALLNSWCGWVTVNRLGQLTVGRAGTPTSESPVRLSVANVISVESDLDKLSGLTTRLAGRRNFSVHSDGDLAPTIPAGLKAELLAEYTVIRSARTATSTPGGTVHERQRLSRSYRHADGAKPQTTQLQASDDIQKEINRVVADCVNDAGLPVHSVVALLPPSQANAIETGQAIHLTWPRDNLVSGRWMQVRDVQSRLFGRRVDLVLSDFEEGRKWRV